MFVQHFRLTERQSKRAIATAEFMVDQLGNIGCDGVTLGDRDTLLGPKVLKKLEKRAGFPFLVANLVDATTGEPFFGTHKILEVAGQKVGVFGLTHQQAARRGWDAKPAEPLPWKVLDPIETAQAQVTALKAKGATIIVALAHLDEKDEKKLADNVEGITTILGGNSAKLSQHPVQAGKTYVAQGYSKGKYVSVLTLNLWKGSDPTSAFVDRYKKQGLATKLIQVDARISSYERRLETQKTAPPVADTSPDKRRPQRKPNTEFYEKQLVKLRADKQLMQMELEELKDPDPKANFINYELAPLGRDMVHEESVEAAIVAFRKKWPKDDPKAKKRLKSIKDGLDPSVKRGVKPVIKSGPTPAGKKGKAPAKGVNSQR